ncbi:tyrosine-type recombinase/integrase [Helcococcus bovis]|uniref:tyrosine-type recombinase/integrase n=1 Tax=Helcococcus bovis TaxID=3153252 RepID=UPI0038B94B33
MNIKKYKDKNGNTRYKFNIYLGIDHLTGKEKRTNRSGFKTEKQAKLEYSRLMTGLSDTKNNRHKFIDVYQEWFEVYKLTVKESTLYDVEGKIKKHILPAFKDVYLDTISLKVTQKWLNELSDELHSFSQYFGYFNAILQFAVSREYISENPCLKVFKPKKEKSKKTKIWTIDELKIFLENMKEYDYKWYAYFRLLAFSGMRKSEGLALNWSDIDFKNNEITISKSLKTYDQKLICGDTKTGNIRTIPMDNNTIEILKKWRKLQFQFFGRLDIIFNNGQGGYTQTTTPAYSFKTVSKKSNLPIVKIHSLRHLHASMLIHSNKSENSIPAMAHRLGHNIDTMLKIYTHLIEKDKKTILDNLIESIS